MSSRRKRAPPSKIDEAEKKLLCWNMHEDRRNELLTLDDELTAEDDVPGPSTSSASFFVINDDSIDEDLIQKDDNFPKSGKFLTANDGEDSNSNSTPVSVQLNIVVLPYCADGSWKVLLGELAFYLPSEQTVSEEFHERGFTLMRGDSDNHLLVCVHKRSEEEYSNGTKECLGAYGQIILVEPTIGGEMLEGLRWLQNKKIIGLYQRPGEGQALKVLILIFICIVFLLFFGWNYKNIYIKVKPLTSLAAIIFLLFDDIYSFYMLMQLFFTCGFVFVVFFS